MKRIVLGVGGASGAIYAYRLIETLRDRPDVSLSVVFSKTARVVWADEIGKDLSSLGVALYNASDMTAPFASGSVRFDAMAVVPCSAGGLARIAQGISTDLIGRAADVTLKERRPLLLVLRESPYSLIHCRQMLEVTQAGATIIPASPSFYTHPATLEAAVDTVLARVLDHLGLPDHGVGARWSGLSQGGVP